VTWQTKKVEVGTKRWAEGEWRVVGDEQETRLEVRSNRSEESFNIPTGLNDPSNYDALAELLIKAMNSVHRRD